MPGPAIQLIVGLGNPGPEYATTRHNAGFWLVEELARRHGGRFRLESRFKGELARIQLAGAERWLLKPQNYMNHSGRVAASVAAFYKIGAESMLVAHDELDLQPGDLRLKQGGGAGGHNGLKDLIAHCGADFWRLRIGVGHPGEREQVTPWLLGATRASERAVLEAAVQQGADAMLDLLEKGSAQAMQKLHTRDS